MLERLDKWLEHRTGYRGILSALLIEHIPGGARWRYVWGSCLAFVFSVQLLTGILLMTAYSPGDSTAWSSVYFIQYQMDFGWLIRGLHHFGSQTMVVLLAVHMLQVVIAGAQLPPREINWWLGLLLMGCVLALSLTGYLLPWDQKGYWATQVATNIAGNLPLAGAYLQKIIVGGPAYGHHTLTRFYTLHVGILPPLVILLTILHLVAFRRHGVTTPRGAAGEGWFWPDQAFRDMVVSLLIFGVMVGLVVWGDGHRVEGAPATAPGAGLYERWAHAGQRGLGANLDAPADPSKEYPARPEWYFLFLFQLLKYFEGPQEIVGTVIIPNAVLLLLALLPLLGYGRMRGFGHAIGVVVVAGLIGCAGYLTYQAIASDRRDRVFQEKREQAERAASRAVALAPQGIPEGGAVLLLRRDPLTEGPRRFTESCAGCHNHGEEVHDTPSRKATASDLAGFGTEDWILRLLTNPGDDHFFGRTGRTTMSDFIETNFDRKNARDQEDLRVIARWLAGHPRNTAADRDSPEFKKGLQTFTARQCNSCHAYEGQGGKRSSRGPDLTGYGDENWLRLMIVDPSHPRRYGLKNAMPAFRDIEGTDGAIAREEWDKVRDLLRKDAKNNKQRQQVDKATQLAQLNAVNRELIVRWLLRDYRIVFGGDPIAGVRQP